MKRLHNINPKQILIIICCLALTTFVSAQQEYQEEDPGSETETGRNNASYKLGSGLNFSFNDGDYTFGLTGFIQPGYFRESVDGFDDVNQFSSKRTFLQFEGNALKEKVSLLSNNY